MKQEPGVPASDLDGDALASFIGDLERTRIRALVERDIETARSLHAPDYQLVTPGGATYTRDEYLGDIESGALDYEVFEPASDIAVVLLGDGAAVRYIARLEVRFTGGVDHISAWHTDLYRVRDGRWQAVWSQATRTRA